MSGNSESAKKSRDKNLANDPEYYSKIGHKGGTAKHQFPGGFGSDSVGKDGLTGKERAKVARWHKGEKDVAHGKETI